MLLCEMLFSQGHETSNPVMKSPNSKYFFQTLWSFYTVDESTKSRNFRVLKRNLTRCLYGAFWRRKIEILRRSKRRWKVQILYFLTGSPHCFMKLILHGVHNSWSYQNLVLVEISYACLVLIIFQTIGWMCKHPNMDLCKKMCSKRPW